MWPTAHRPPYRARGLASYLRLVHRAASLETCAGISQGGGELAVFPKPYRCLPVLGPLLGGLFNLTAGAQGGRRTSDRLTQWCPGGQECFVSHSNDDVAVVGV